MRVMPDRLVLLIVLVVLAGLVAVGCASDSPTTSPPGPLPSLPTDDQGTPESAEVSSAVQEVLDEFAQQGYRGVLLVDDGTGPQSVGVGAANRDGAVIDADTVFDIGSLTKQFTGAAILRLQMDGQVSVTEPVGTYLPQLPPAIGDITLHQLLTHTGGLPDTLGSDYDTVDLKSFIDLVADEGLTTDPGEQHSYSNVGYSLLGAVIEQVTGQDYEAYLHDHLFVPAGMNHTGYRLPSWSEATVTEGFLDDESLGAPNEQPWAEDGPYWHLRANGGLLSTANDMYRWHLALEGSEILDAEAKAALYGRHVAEGPGADTFYGYGWAIFPSPTGSWFFTHNGGNGVFFADFLRFPDEDLVVFFATNDAGAVSASPAFAAAAAVLNVDLGGDGESADCTPTGDAVDHLLNQAEAVAGSAGVAVDEFFAALDAGPAATLSFVEDHLAPDLIAGADDARIQAEFAGFRDEFGPLGIEGIVAEEPGVVRLRLRPATDTPAAEVLIVSFGVEGERITCLSIDA